MSADDISVRLRDESCGYGIGHALLMQEGAQALDTALKALRSIAANTCCDTCREAALVARSALGAMCADRSDLTREDHTLSTIERTEAGR